MHITLRRTYRDDKVTTGAMFINDQLECFTLEDPVRVLDADHDGKAEGKIMHETAIPAGTYPITIAFSPKFKKRLPLLQGVPFFTGILIHSGNKPEDTWGCILVGASMIANRIPPGSSTPALVALMSKIEAAIAKGDTVDIEICDQFALAASV